MIRIRTRRTLFARIFTRARVRFARMYTGKRQYKSVRSFIAFIDFRQCDDAVGYRESE